MYINFQLPQIIIFVAVHVSENPSLSFSKEEIIIKKKCSDIFI